jgi:two-component system NarL family sensor kinase
MTAADGLRRRVAEEIQAGPLQDVLAACQEMMELAAIAPAEQLDRALASLGEASARLRHAIFDLHPVLIDERGLGPAIEQLANAVAVQSGIEIVVEVEVASPHQIDPVVFGVVRELLSNVVRHSQAGQALVELVVTGDAYLLEVVDDGIGLGGGSVPDGCVGLAAQRARIEATGGTFSVLESRRGTRIRVEIPLLHPWSGGRR